MPTTAPTPAPSPRPVRPPPAPIITPVLSGISPASGTTDGGVRVSIVGKNFSTATQVLFGGLRGTDIKILSDTELSVTTPARTNPGNVSVRVFTVRGRSASESPVEFRFAHTPTLTAIAPATGSTAGGRLVRITGTDLGGTSAVLFGDVPATVVTVSPTLVRAIAPAREGSGPADVRVTTLGGTSLPVPAASFVYADTPAVAAISPTSGPTGGGTTVTLTGANLSDAVQVDFGGRPGANLEVVSATELRVDSPVRTSLGDVAITAVTAGGISIEMSETAAFSYVVPTATEQKAAVDYWPLGLIGLLSWSVWFIRRFLSRHRYQPVVNDFRTTTSVVVPVYREDPHVLERCLRTWLAEDPTEVILVVDDLDDALLDHLNNLKFDRVTILPWRHTGKRGALGAGVRIATGDLVVFADSDTEWRPGLLAAMQMPFVDPEIGGVGSRQHVYLPQTNIWRRVAYWMLNTRYLDYVPAMSRRGGVACLSGRTAAYRREVILPLMPALEHEIFLGRECIAGDDGRLTWLVLADGHKTVYQDTAQADSMFPADLQAFIRQRVRWSRNSYRCYLTALSQGWLWRQPFITQVTVLQILLTPVSMGAAIWYGAGWVSEGGWIAAAIVAVWAVAGRALRGLSHLMENPREIVIAPLVVLAVAGIALPIKLWAAITMNKQGWLTRKAGQRVQGQQEIEVPA